jgi:hypothetical protein
MEREESCMGGGILKKASKVAAWCYDANSYNIESDASPSNTPTGSVVMLLLDK